MADDTRELAGLLKALETDELPPLPAAPARCIDCGLPSWLPALNVTFDETKHCLAQHLSTKPGCWPDVLACKDRTIARQREQLAIAKHLLQRQHDLLDEAAAELGVDLG